MGITRHETFVPPATNPLLASIEALEPRRMLAVTAPPVTRAWLSYRENPWGSTTRLRITWNDNNAGETGYRVEYSEDGASNWRNIGADLPANSTFATQELSAGQKYYYRVRAVSGETVSAPSSIISPSTPVDRVVQVQATAFEGVTELAWAADPDAKSYRVYRKLRDQATWSVVPGGAALNGTSTGFADYGVSPGVMYEYQIERDTRNFYGIGGDGLAYGYVTSGYALPLIEDRGRVLLVVDEQQAPHISAELDRLRQDLIGDGWTVERMDVARDNGDPRRAQTVRAGIESVFAASTQPLRSIILVGHVPVPYSGVTNWDGHANHVGAWPADAFYGDGLGVYRAGTTGSPWTDVLSEPNSTFPANSNQPGDGKWDQDNLPTRLTVPVGRIDFASLPEAGHSFTSLPPSVFVTESLLLKRYLDRDHAWRVGTMRADTQALIDDHLGGSQPENGWRNFAPLVGAENTHARDWETSLTGSDSYLLAFGAGPGSSDSIHGVTTIYQLHSPTKAYNAVFTMLYGSYFGDWNFNSNVMREMLSANGMALTSAWVGSPNWFVHGMGMGETIGENVMITQNLAPGSTYQPAAIGMRGMHMALMGDPTLRMTAVEQVQAVSGRRRSANTNSVSWIAPNDSAVEGYHVYRATNPDGPFVRLTPEPVPAGGQNVTFQDGSVLNPNLRLYYMVRAVKLQATPSGAFYDASVGVVTHVDPWIAPSDERRDAVTPPAPGSTGGGSLGLPIEPGSLFSTASIAATDDDDLPISL